MGVSVTNRIKVVKQPRGGYINPKYLDVIQLPNKSELNSNENISPILMGLVVDYLTRFINGNFKEEAFKISLIGAKMMDEEETAYSLLSKINGLDDKSIECAMKLVGYDTVYRAGIETFHPVEYILPDKETMENIRIMVNRSIDFLKLYGPVIKDGFTLDGGYTTTISSGDGDYLTKDTLWDFKVSKNEPTNKHTLQLLIYYIMGKHSKFTEFNDIIYVGIYNPRLNKVFKYEINKINKNVIKEIEKNVIGY